MPSRKENLEISKLEHELKELQKQWWRRKDFYGFYGTVIAAILGVSGTVAVNIATSNRNTQAIAKLEMTRQYIEDLGSPDYYIRQNAGRLLSRLETRYTEDPILAAYENSRKRQEHENEDAATRTSYVRVGIMEAIGSRPGDWKFTYKDLTDLLKRGVRDPSPLVRHKAIVGLLNTDSASVDYYYKLEVQRFKTVKKMPAVSPSNEMILIPATRAVIGADSFDASESPEHERSIDSFWIDSSLVSNGQWNAVMPGDKAPGLENNWKGCRRVSKMTRACASNDYPGAQAALRSAACELV